MSTEKSDREKLIDRYESMCGLNPDAVGRGGSIDTTAPVVWRVKKWGYDHQITVSNVTGGDLVDVAIEKAPAISK